MPYDARPISEGGNRGAGETFQLQAPKGKFRVIGVDTFDGGDWVQGDFDTLDAAMAEARSKAGEMTKMYVYDDKGSRPGNFGRF